MQKRRQTRPGQTRPVNQAGMGQLIHQHRILPVRNRSNHSQGGSITGGKTDRRFSPLQSGQGLFQTGMFPPRPRHQAGCHGSGPFIPHRTGKSLRQGRMVGQPQIIVACQIDHFPAIRQTGHSSGQAFHIPQDAQQPRRLQL